MNIYHAMPGERGWELIKQGATRPSKRAQSRDELVETISEFMINRPGVVKFYYEDGSLQEERTYSPTNTTEFRKAGNRPIVRSALS